MKLHWTDCKMEGLLTGGIREKSLQGVTPAFTCRERNYFKSVLETMTDPKHCFSLRVREALLSSSTDKFPAPWILDA